MRRFVSLLVLAVALCAGASTAQAGKFGFSVGRDLGAIDFTGAQEVTNIGTRLGYLGGQVHFFGNLDFARYELTTDYESPDFNDVENGGALYTVGVGFRYFFSEPEADKAVPYGLANAYTIIPWVKQTGDQPTGDGSAFGAGFLAGFGAEYFFADAFSIGGEVGFNGFFGHLTQDQTRWEGNVLQLYTGIQFNFYL